MSAGVKPSERAQALTLWRAEDVGSTGVKPSEQASAGTHPLEGGGRGVSGGVQSHVNLTSHLDGEEGFGGPGTSLWIETKPKMKVTKKAWERNFYLFLLNGP